MPTGTRVDRCYQKVKKTRGEASAAKICQSATGQALATGKPPKNKSLERHQKLLSLRKRYSKKCHCKGKNPCHCS